MEESKVLQIIEEINENKELQSNISNAKSAEDIINIMTAAGYQVTPENARIAFEQLQSGIEFDEDELDDVAGGVILETILYGSLVAYTICLAMGIGGAIFSMKTSKRR